MVPDKEMEAQEDQVFLWGPEAMSGLKNSAFRKNKANSASKKKGVCVKMWGGNKKVGSPDKHQAGVRRSGCTLDSPGEPLEVPSTWAAPHMLKSEFGRQAPASVVLKSSPKNSEII